MTLDGVGAIQLGAKRLIQFFVSMWQLRSAQVNFEVTFSNNGPTLKDELQDCDSFNKLQRCVVTSCGGLTCWASSSCLTQMTNHRVLAETTSEYIIFVHQFFLLVRLKILHHQPRTSLSHILPCELAQCPIIYYRNTATDALAYTKTNYLCVKSVMKSQCPNSNSSKKKQPWDTVYWSLTLISQCQWSAGHISNLHQSKEM